MTEYVAKYYEMDPATEDLLFDGTYLREGMVVLLGDPDERMNPDSLFENAEQRKNMCGERNLWCAVTVLKTAPSTVSFIGVYEDGTKKKRTVSTKSPWLVKINTVPSEAWNEWAKDTKE